MTASNSQPRPAQTILALDVGTVRIGVASARLDVAIAQPLTTLDQGPDIMAEIAKLVAAGPAERLVVGWPRGLEGQTTQQTSAIEAFVAELRQTLDVPVELQDEALTSRKAEAELESRGKAFSRADVDALAATYILEDYLAERLHRSGQIDQAVVPHV